MNVYVNLLIDEQINACVCVCLFDDIVKVRICVYKYI